MPMNSPIPTLTSHPLDLLDQAHLSLERVIQTFKQVPIPKYENLSASILLTQAELARQKTRLLKLHNRNSEECPEAA